MEKPDVLSDEDVIIPPKSKRRLRVFTEPLVRELIQQACQDTARTLFETIEIMYPELRSVYWNSKKWQSLKSEYLEAHNSQSGIIRL